MSQQPLYVGIDVAKAQLDVAIRPTGQRWQVSYTEQDIQESVSQLTGLQPTLVILEASGVWNCPWWLPWQPLRCPWWWSTPAK